MRMFKDVNLIHESAIWYLGQNSNKNGNDLWDKTLLLFKPTVVFYIRNNVLLNETITGHVKFSVLVLKVVDGVFKTSTEAVHTCTFYVSDINLNKRELIT